ncbi:MULTISPECIES: hypothetical protein [unclassified Streptomyces]
MKLGKALATGVAQERPQAEAQGIDEPDLRLPEEIEELRAPEEAPAAR